MAQRAIDAIRANLFSPYSARNSPPLGMRGGLGKTLLIAFLLLAIVPLSLLAFLTYNQIQRDTEQKLMASLEGIVTLKEAHLADWVESQQAELSLVAEALDEGADPASWLATIQATDPTLAGLALVDSAQGGVVVSVGAEAGRIEDLPSAVWEEPGLFFIPATGGDGRPLPAITYAWAGRLLVGLMTWDSLCHVVSVSDNLGERVDVRLLTGEGLMVSAEGATLVPVGGGEVTSPGIAQAMEGRSGAGAYKDLAGKPVFGAYRWNPELGVAILAEQAQVASLASGNTLTALVVGATLGVALITAASAAAVTRRITRPIVQLTETAAWMARGDLNQRVPVTRKDEIGVLARAFNRMASELKLLYGNLEAKVAERTRQLEEANQHTQYYIMQLAISAEVARVASSIRDVDVLLSTVVDLIGRAFELYHASIYLLDDTGLWAEWQVGSGDGPSGPRRVAVSGPTLVGQVAANGLRRAMDADASTAEEGVNLSLSVGSQLAVPLRVRGRTLGVLDLQSQMANAFGESEQLVYRSLADQIGIAIENARAYAIERETVERLQELDRIQARFLLNMSHALRVPLNSVIGFSRVMLKGLDGPLNEMQEADLTQIYESGRQLLGLINDMLDLSQLDLGVAPFAPTEVNLGEIVEGVMATTHALARGKAVQLYQEVPEDLPSIYTDGQRVRQLILALLSNAVKFTDTGSIWLRVSADDEQVTVSVSDTGKGIPEVERARIFSDDRYGQDLSGEHIPGFGLAISKKVVERLGGQIWLESKEGKGSTFTFTLPIEPKQPSSDGMS